MSSASESELAALYYSCKDVVPICTTLEEMGHPQLKCTMITTNNITVQAPWAPRHLKLPNLWINISIGSNAAMHNVNSSISGIVALTTVQTMHQTSSHKTYQAVYKFTSRTPFHVNENHPTISSCFQTSHLSWSHDPAMIHFPLTLQPSMHLQRCVNIPVILIGYLRLTKHNLNSYWLLTRIYSLAVPAIGFQIPQPLFHNIDCTYQGGWDKSCQKHEADKPIVHAISFAVHGGREGGGGGGGGWLWQRGAM